MTGRPSSADVVTWSVDCLEAALADAGSPDRGGSAARAVVAGLGAEELLRVVGCLASLAVVSIPPRVRRGTPVGEQLVRFRLAAMWSDDA